MSSTYASEERFRKAFNEIEAHIERRYGIPVVVGDVAEPFTGDLDGARIEVDYDQSSEDALFIIAHLFCHTVQWNLDPDIGIVKPQDAQMLDSTASHLEILRRKKRSSG